MLQRSPEKVVTLQKEIYKDIYHKSEWAYVKVQSLFEYAGKYFLDISLIDDLFVKTNPINLDILTYLNNRYVHSSELINIFKKMNQKANIIKHSVDENRLQEISYDEGFLKECFSAYNMYVKTLFMESYRFFLLNEIIFKKCTALAINQKAESITRKVPQATFTTNIPVVQNDLIRVYCGTGKQDYGFIVHGLSKTMQCENIHARIYATIFSFLQRNRIMKKSSKLLELEVNDGIVHNYSNIYRYQIIILLLIRANLLKNNVLTISLVTGSFAEFKYAALSVFEYASMLAELMQVDYLMPEILESSSGVCISLDNTYSDRTNVYVENCLTPQENTTREIWQESAIRYSFKVSARSNKILNIFLYDFFGYASFKPGQVETLQIMLNSPQNALCILPTGGGKSLIYYFLAFMQPCPTLIVEPTDILIKDQIRNMIDRHGIDDVQTIGKNDLFTKGYFQAKNKFIFVTPSVFQYQSLVCRIIALNNEHAISNIILDEIHTISQWSHDFRPDYLMLSFNLLTFIDHPRMFCFTATANYRVVNDIRSQIPLKADEIVLPISLQREDLSFEYIPCSDEPIFFEVLNSKVDSLSLHSSRNINKMLAFTKDISQSRLAVKSVSMNTRYQIDVFNAELPNSYLGFIKGRKSVLVADTGMGIGINLLDIQSVFHLGLPISKAQYVQEIGRSSRMGQGAVSTVVFKSKMSMSEPERRMIDFNTSIDEILGILDALPDDNDLAYAFRMILGHVEHYAAAATNICSLYEQLEKVDNFTVVRFDLDGTDPIELKRQQIYLYFLHRMGVVYNWYIQNEQSRYIEYLIEVEHNKSDLSTIKEQSIGYISQLSQDNKTCYQIEEAVNTKEIIYIVQQWYFNEFLYYHREQLLNTLDFFEINAKGHSSDKEIMSQLAEYFTISSVSLTNEADYLILSLSIREILEWAQKNQNSEMVASCEHFIENQYNAKLDLFIFSFQLFASGHFNASRFERIVSQIDESLWIDFQDNIYIVYRSCSDFEKLQLFNCLCLRAPEQDMLEIIFEKNPKDLIYYGYLTQIVNLSINK